MKRTFIKNKIILVVALLLAIQAIAQPFQSVNNYGFRYKRLIADSSFRIPIGAMLRLANNLTGTQSAGHIFFNTSDSSIYCYTGVQWLRVGSNATSSNGITKVGNNFKLGGSLSEFTNINGNSNGVAFFNNSTLDLISSSTSLIGFNQLYLNWTDSVKMLGNLQTTTNDQLKVLVRSPTGRLLERAIPNLQSTSSKFVNGLYINLDTIRLSNGVVPLTQPVIFNGGAKDFFVGNGIDSVGNVKRFGAYTDSGFVLSDIRGNLIRARGDSVRVQSNNVLDLASFKTKITGLDSLNLIGGRRSNLSGRNKLAVIDTATGKLSFTDGSVAGDFNGLYDDQTDLGLRHLGSNNRANWGDTSYADLFAVKKIVSDTATALRALIGSGGGGGIGGTATEYQIAYGSGGYNEITSNTHFTYDPDNFIVENSSGSKRLRFNYNDAVLQVGSYSNSGTHFDVAADNEEISMTSGGQSQFVLNPNQVSLASGTTGLTLPYNAAPQLIGTVRGVATGAYRAMIIDSTTGVINYTDFPSGGSGGGWGLTGNSGTSQTSNFIGTTDRIGFNIKTNNTVRVSIDRDGDITFNSTTAPKNLYNFGAIFSLGAGSRNVYTEHSSTLNGINYTDGTNAIFFSAGGYDNGFKIDNLASSSDYYFSQYGAATFPATLQLGYSVAHSATANIDIAASGGSFPPFRYAAGTSTSTPIAGAKEYDGSNELLTAGDGVRYTLAKTLTNTATIDFESTSAQTESVATITVTGAALGDVVALGIPNSSITTLGFFQAYVSAANTVSIKFLNLKSSGALDPASGAFRVSVIKY